MRCSICNHTVNKLIFNSTESVVYECSFCTGVLLYPASSLEKAYTAEYYISNYQRIEKAQIDESKNICKLVRKYTSGGSILDYGCGSGIFLKIANEFGFNDNIGVDVSLSAIEYAKKNNSNGFNTFQLTNSALGSKKFDIISFLDSVSHISEISDLLEKLKINNMHENSLMIIRTPRINRSYLLYASVLAKILPIKYAKNMYFVSTRYILFNEKSIHEFLKRHGFEILHLELQNDYKKINKTFRECVRYFLFEFIPHIINSKNSMIIIAGRL